MTLELELPDALAEALRTFAAARGEDVNTYAVATLAAHAQERAAVPRYTEEQRAAARAALGEIRPHDPEAVFRKFGMKPDDRTLEEIAASAQAALDRMNPELRAQLEREELI